MGVAIAAVVFLVAFYPNLSGLPLPSDFANVYQGLLPTWHYYFQFAVNTDPPIEGSLVDGLTIAVGTITLLLGLIVMVLARFWGTSRRLPAGPVAEGAEGA